MSTPKIIFIIWFAGYVLSIYPIARALTRQHVRTEAKKNYGKHADIQHGDVANNMALASFMGLGWFLAIPYWASHFIHTMSKPSLEGEAEKRIEEHITMAELKARMKSARKEIETSSKVWRDD